VLCVLFWGRLRAGRVVFDVKGNPFLRKAGRFEEVGKRTGICRFNAFKN